MGGTLGIFLTCSYCRLSNVYFLIRQKLGIVLPTGFSDFRLSVFAVRCITNDSHDNVFFSLALSASFDVRG